LQLNKYYYYIIIFLRLTVRGHKYSCRLDSYRLNDTDTRRHTAECFREKKTLLKTVTTTICQVNPFKRQRHWYCGAAQDPSQGRQAAR